MPLTYYSSPSCSESSRLNATYLNPGFCAIDNVFAPAFTGSFVYECLQSGYIAPAELCQGLPPDPLFVCINGVYVLQNSFTGGTLTIPSSTSAQIVGNVTVTQSIVLSGTEASLTIAGCLYLNGTVQISLTSEELMRLAKTGQKLFYVSYSSNSCFNATDLSTVDVKLSATGNRGCEKFTSKSEPTKQTLALTFSLDDSACNNSRWWIILAAAIGAVVLIVIALILVVTLVPAVRAKVKPFWVKHHRNANDGNINKADRTA